MTWQPEPEQSSPEGPASDASPGLPDDPSQVPSARPRRSGRRLAGFGALLAAGLAGLAISALGIAHNILPRQFTVAQRRQIAAWELERRWRALPAGAMFPDSVSYMVLSGDLESTSGLTLQARLLSINPATSCAAALSGAAAQALSQHGCTAAMRATYVDSTGSLVATVTVAVLPSTAAERSVIQELTDNGVSAELVRALPVPGTPAAGFSNSERQLTSATGAGPYVILSTVGFADGRPHDARLSEDSYLEDEMLSLTSGLANTAEQALGKPLPPLVCPGAPEC